MGRPPGNQVSPDAQAVTHHPVPDPKGAGKWPGGALIQGLERGRQPGCSRTGHGRRPARGPLPTAVTLTRQFLLLSLCCPNQAFKEKIPPGSQRQGCGPPCLKQDSVKVVPRSLLCALGGRRSHSRLQLPREIEEAGNGAPHVSGGRPRKGPRLAPGQGFQSPAFWPGTRMKVMPGTWLEPAWALRSESL